ncbi:hypothetical protein ILUMI_21614 [Ignelater luminosus]|uniref:MULE transposase domain-containing protein n=1 Tax=Ignelater luminosus TaxID=2038154 RepID=A0A8K0CIM3_IGNLU|nr:hypothetical protein ILUMI_21614 [Ignelater luminosus]
MSVFEKPILNAFRSSFPGAIQKGCFFHSYQTVYRKIQSLPEVLHLYSNDPEFAYQIRQLSALAFIPPDDLHLVYDVLMDEPFFVADGMQPLLAEFTTYFELTWVGRWNRQRTGRSAPMFNINLWNYYHLVLEDMSKKNNNCGACNWGFSFLLVSTHPTTYKFIGGLKKKQALTETKIEQMYNGNTHQQ